MKTIILGAGMTGLAAGYKKKIPIYEASDHVGGICTTYMKEGFEFDVGGTHWIFGNNEAVEFVKSLVPVNTYDRRAGVYYNKIFPYPIQNFALKEFEGVGENNKSLRSWLGQKFGKELCNMFFFPFNEKYTAGFYDEIIQFDPYKTPKAGEVGYCPQFHNPVNGLKSLVDKLKEGCNIHLNKKAVQVNTISHKIKFSDGTEERYDQLISTIPLNVLLNISGRQNFTLPYSSVFVLNIGFEPGPMLPKEHWLYVPFCRSGFYRVGFYTNVEPSKAPEGMASICVEMAFRGVNYDDIDVDFAIQEIVSELKDWNWIKEVKVVDPTWVQVAYTWNKTEEERIEHLKWLEKCGIKSIGRYGLWKFQGIAESIQQGLSV